MQWSEISSILIMLLLLGWTISLTVENGRLKKENYRLLRKSGEYEEIQIEAKETLKITTEIKTIKSLREKYNLSLVNAKEIVDSVKE